MNILVINGSPKGKNSITYQTCLYLEKLFSKHNFSVLHVGQQIKKFEKDMTEAKKALESADLLLFSYPVYTFIAPSQLHRFIELIKEKGIDLSGKIATQITTSKHFYDVTAHRYIQDNCVDLGVNFIKGLSADMDDLTKKQGQTDAVKFLQYVEFCVEHRVFEKPSVGKPSETGKYTRTLEETEKDGSEETVIVTDLLPEDTVLADMIADFRACYPYKTRVINIREFPFDGGCISCFNCAATGKCIYKDGFDTFLREEIQKAASIVYAFSVKDHSMGAQFKLYDDRQFCNGHRTVTMGMSMGYIVNGDLESEENLRTVIEARAEVGHNFYCGAAVNSAEIENMAKRMAYAIENSYVQPQNFYGVGGMKIFRDLIYLMQGLMKADHKFYKEHKIYDFPQKKIGTLLFMKLVGGMMTNPKIKKKLGGNMTEGMLMPYKKVLEHAEPLE